MPCPRRRSTPAATRTLSGLLAAPSPRRREIVPGVLPTGLSLLAGRPHAGKSWLSLQLALAVASGSQVVDLQKDVLYLALEDPPGRLQRRLRQLAAPTHLAVQFATAWLPLDRGGLRPLAQHLVQGRRFVVIDTFNRAVSIACLPDPDGLLEVLARLHYLAAAFDAAILLVDRHPFREGKQPPVADALDLAYAAAGCAGLFAGTMTLSRPFGQSRATLTLSGCPHPVVLSHHPELKHPTLGAGA